MIARRYFYEQQFYLLMKLFHRDIRATLSQYSRNIRELSALYGDILAIRRGYRCYIKIYTHSDKYYSCNYEYIDDIIFRQSDKTIYYDNRFLNIDHNIIFKNVYYHRNSKRYICTNMIAYPYCCTMINMHKYKFDNINDLYYIHYITNSIVLKICLKFDIPTYRVYSIYDFNNSDLCGKINDNGSIKKLLYNAMNLYHKYFKYINIHLLCKKI
jgi:hypothetical protein